MNCSAAERDILLYNYCRSVVVVQMRFKINDSLLYRCSCVGRVLSLLKTFKSEEEEEDKEDKKEDKKEETLETKMK